MPDLVSILSDILYRVEVLHLSVDSAFKQTCEKVGCRTREYDKEFIYKVARDFVSHYYQLLEILKLCGMRYSRKEMSRLYLVLRGADLGIKVPSKVRKKFKSLLARIEKEEVLEKPWIKYSYPRWFYEYLLNLLEDEHQVENLLRELNRRRIWLRVNTLKADYDKALKLLESEGVEYEIDRDVWYMLKVTKVNKPLHKLECIRKGLVVPQDKASALVVEALKPEPQSVVYDLAAAPGMKTSLIMQITENRAYVVAVDVSRKRVKAMRHLLKLLGVDMSRVDVVIADSRLNNLRRRADYVLVDAPCSSSGAIPKDPAVKIHLLKRSRIEYYVEIQREMLMRGLEICLHKLVYATCSLFPEEGEEHIEYIVRNSLARAKRPQIPGVPGYHKYMVSDVVRRLYPHIHETEGFFIAELIPY